EYSLPYTPQLGQCNNPSTEFYDEELNKCCSQCPPGQYRTGSCSHTVDTKCSPCRAKTYTAIWNLSPQCFACSPPCRKGLVQNQTCTRSQDRICSCPPHKYCVSKLDGYCELCRAHRRCGKGYRVSRRGTESTDTECKPCPPGTFSSEESFNTSCTPHTVCKSVAVPGNRRNDTVCSDSGTATVLPHTNLNLLLTQSSDSHKPEIITQPVVLNSVPDLSHIVGAVAGPLLLVLIIAVLGYCLVSKKKGKVHEVETCKSGKSFIFFPTNLSLPFPSAEKQCDKKVRETELQKCRSSEQEQQHLLETSGSSSSTLNNPTGSASISEISEKNDGKKKPEGFQQQHSPAEGCKLHSGDRHSSVGSEHSGNGGTQVNVTCIVKVCSPDCSPQGPEHTGSACRDCGNAPSCSPTGEETPLSKEENALKKETEIHISVENEDDLLQDLLPEEKKVPVGIPDAGMKTS
ncbi:TNR1B factor, partial [Climacteris rufus]|nr:TNR1B factor [Climacteris rufus]